VLGVGPSGLPPDVKLFNIPPQDLNPMMVESTEIIAKLLESDEPVSYEGRYWKIRDMALQLRSYQQPRLKFATPSVGSKRSLEFAAKYEMLLFSLAGGGPPNAIPISGQWDVIEEAGRKFGTNPSRDDWRIVTYVHLAETREKAWAEVEANIVRDVHQYFYTINGPEQWVNPGQDPANLTAKEIVEKRRWIIGTPDDAIEQIERFHNETGGIGGLMMTTHEWVSQQKINHSLELFARYVMPHFRGHTAPVQAAWERTKSDAAAKALPKLGGPPIDSPSVAEHRSNTYVDR
jgi:limonene 1,2-monooxygenase